MSKKFTRKKVLPSKTLNRKERRKEERKLKKARRDAFAHRDFEKVKTFKSLDTAFKAKCEEEKAARLKNKKVKKKEVKKEEKKKVEDARVQGLKIAIQKDEKELKQLEKNLNFRKKKGKTSIPMSFTNDGLDYILDATDSEKIKTFEDVGPGVTEDTDSELGSDMEDMLGDESDQSDNEDNISPVHDPSAKASKSILKSKETIKQTKAKNSVVFADPEEESDSMSVDQDDQSASENSDEDDEGEMDNDEEENSDDEGSEGLRGIEKSPETSASQKRKHAETEESELKEDIYGRLRDKAGNIVPSNKTGAYIPPAKRALLAGGNNDALRKKLKGLVNKVSEGTLQVVSSQVESLYLDHSRAEVNTALTTLVSEALVSPVLAPERLAAEMVLLVAVLHGNVGTEVGAYFLQEMVKTFDQLLLEPEYGLGKTMENVLVIIANIYNFQVVHSAIIFDIMERFIVSFGDRDIELILLLLKTVGFTLRKDDPARLKQIILDIQTKAKTVESSSGEALQSRIRFMLDILMAVRNNNMRKIPSYDPTTVEHLKKIAKNFIRGQGLGEDQLNIGLSDLLKADQVGRWWIVGSAWEGRSEPSNNLKDAKTRTETSVVGSVSAHMMKLAKQQGINTDIRRHVFFILGSSEDFEDAFARLLRLGLNRTQEREIIHVLFHCCLNEKNYNPYYAYLAQKLCKFDRRFTMTVQFSMWDKFKEVEKMDKASRSKLAKLLSHLLLAKSLSLSIFKVIEFGMEGKRMIRFLTQVLTEVITNTQTATITELFERIAPFPKLKALRQGLQVFMRIYLKGGHLKGISDDELQDRLEMSEAAMFSGQASSLL